VEKRAIFGVRFFDLKALALYDEVFKKDAYYQKQRKNIFVVGMDEKSQIVKTRRDFTLSDLEYVPFDIFFDVKICYAGTDVGEDVLKKLKIPYINLRQVGNISPRDRAEAREIHEVFEKSYNHKIWDELGKICIACGKCAIACPTCFCFDFEDSVKGEKACRDRVWGNCFYQDFSKIAGGPRPLNASVSVAGGYVFKDKIAERIRFWYMHKFLRIPNDYGMVGCVGCGRCSEVCPVEIDVRKNLKKIMGEK
jgi:ferredoxin